MYTTLFYRKLDIINNIKVEVGGVMKNLAEVLVYQAKLTAREIEICLRIMKGETTLEMAEKMCITKKTIDYHFGKIFSKMEVKKREYLILLLNELVREPEIVIDRSILPTQITP
jgi:DNA-binding CsgD family transcriptional regulator